MTGAVRGMTNPFGLLALLGVVLAVAIACGPAEEQELSGPTLTPSPSPTLTQIASAATTRVASPPATRAVLPTPTRFAIPTRAAITVAPTPILIPTPFLAPTPTRVVPVTRTFVPTPTTTYLRGGTTYAGPTPTRASSPTPTPTAFRPTSTPIVPTRTPVAAPTPTPIVPTSSSSAASLTFAHTEPGVQSEVYLEIQIQPGTVVTATLRGLGIVGAETQTTTGGNGGQVLLTWTINAFGEYSVSGTASTSSFSTSVVVE